VYNFEKEIFEIKNLSKKYPLYVNGDPLYQKDHPLPLGSKDVVSVGGETFVFLLPVN
jgi:hypothetical protein